MCSSDDKVMIGATRQAQVVGTSPEEVSQCDASQVTRGRQRNDVALKYNAVFLVSIIFYKFVGHFTKGDNQIIHNNTRIGGIQIIRNNTQMEWGGSTKCIVNFDAFKSNNSCLRKQNLVFFDS